MVFNQQLSSMPQQFDYTSLLSTTTGKSSSWAFTSLSTMRIAFWKYLPFGVHFTLTALIAAAFLRFLDGRAFNTNSRRPQYRESDGTLSRLHSYAPLQSDITTAVSVAATITRVAAGWWSGGYIWRCIFVSMERGGISLDGLSQAVSNRPPLPCHFKQKSNMIIISVTLFATYSIDYFSAALTGSITWEADSNLVHGSVPVTGILRGVPGTDVTSFYDSSDFRSIVLETGIASGNIAWPRIQPNFTIIMEPPPSHRRVVDGAAYLPVNSTLNNVTVPYFSIDAFEWITQPHLTLQQVDLLSDYYKPFSPWVTNRGKVALLPDLDWGPPRANQSGNPEIISKTQLLAFRLERAGYQGESCRQNYSIDPGSQINLIQIRMSTGYDCFAIANVTYRAGAATCKSCKLIAPTVVEAPDSIPLTPDVFTSMALGLAPLMGNQLMNSGYRVPPNYGTNKSFAIDLTSHAYQAAWAALADNMPGARSEATDVKIALPTFRVKVIPWRVYLWAGLHIWVLALGLLFVYIQSRCAHPWVNDPTMAVFWLDMSAVSTSLGSDDHDVDQWLPGTKLPKNNGMLTLHNASRGSRSAKLE